MFEPLGEAFPDRHAHGTAITVGDRVVIGSQQVPDAYDQRPCGQLRHDEHRSAGYTLHPYQGARLLRAEQTCRIFDDRRAL